MITINIFNLLFYLFVALLIWTVTPEEYKEGLGFPVSIIIQIAWLFIALSLFIFFNMNILISFN